MHECGHRTARAPVCRPGKNGRNDQQDQQHHAANDPLVTGAAECWCVANPQCGGRLTAGVSINGGAGENGARSRSNAGSIAGVLAAIVV